MTFPATPLSIGVEMLIGGAWVDISGDVYARDKISITRGRADESSQAAPTRMALTLDNRTGNYSPRNPSGAYYGLIGRNTPIRCWVANGATRARHPDALGTDQWLTGDKAQLDITGDIDLRSDLSLPTWRPSGTGPYFLGIYKGSANIAYQFLLKASGALSIRWTTTGGGTFGAVSMTSDRPVPGGTIGRKAVRVTLDVNNGAGGRTATFYVSSDGTMAGSWIQFSQVTATGATSIYNTSETLGTVVDMAGAEVFETQVLNGIGGTLVANPIFTSQPSGGTSFYDAQGNLWSANGTAIMDNKHYRFWGEVSSWPLKWDSTGTDVYVQLECQGQMRRIAQGSTPVKSALRRGISAIGAPLVGYWPLEDGQSAQAFEPGIAGQSPGRVVGAPTLAGYSAIVASAPLPAMHTGRAVLNLPFYANTNAFQVRFVMHVPPNTIPTNTVLLRIRTNSSLGWIDWIYQSGDNVFLQCYTNLGVATATGTGLDITDQVNGQDTRVSLEFVKNGTGVDIREVVLPIGEELGIFRQDTIAGITLGSCTQVYVNPDGADLGEFAIGHVSIENAISSVFDSVHSLERAYQGEAANTRIARLGDENSIAVRLAGDNDGAEFLGYQPQSSVLPLMQDAAAADGGILIEDRGADQLLYRTRESIYDQFPAATIAYSDNNLQSFSPVDDDQRTRNRVTISRSGGASATVEDTDSKMSTLAPPAGVGIYDEAATVSLYSDGQPFHQAGWAVRLGTVDESRFPTIGIDLAHPDFAADANATLRLLSIDVGDRLTVTSPPAWLPPETIDQIVQGYSESFWQYGHEIDFTCVPARPYRAAMYGDAAFTARYANDNTTVNGAHNSSTTSLSVTFSRGPIWTIADGSFDIMVAGERMTVTNVTGAASPQTLTVTRSVNGVVKAQTGGTAVALFDPAYYALGASPGSGLNTDIAEGHQIRAMDHSFPDVVAEYGNGVNTITSGSFANLPSFPCRAQMVNPHPGSNLMVMVAFGAWGSASANDVRISVRVSRSNQDVYAAGITTGATVGWGEIAATAETTTTQMFATFTCELPPSPVPYVFEVQALRTTSGTQDVRYATCRVIPLRYVSI